MYHLFANIKSLNEARKARWLTTFAFRPHAGEAGDVSHLAVTFLLAESINHGINIRLSPLEYLYYLDQIPIGVSPVSMCAQCRDGSMCSSTLASLSLKLSNNRLFLRLRDNPFGDMFK